MERPRKRLAWCERCERVEYVEQAGPYFDRCTECLVLVPVDLPDSATDGADYYVGKFAERAPLLTGEQVEKLRRLLPPIPAPVVDAAARRARTPVSEERRAAVRRMMEQTRREHGLPAVVDDPAEIDRIATILACRTCRGSGWLPVGAARCPDCAP